MSSPKPLPRLGWALESTGRDDGTGHRVALVGFPFTIGRRWGQSLQLDDRKVSSNHARIDHTGQALIVRDLDSTNGTTVNHKGVSGAVALRPGDVVAFAGFAYRIVFTRPDSLDEGTQVTHSSDVIPDEEALAKRLHGCDLSIGFQPIVSLDGPQRPIVGYEALARARWNGMPCNPGRLFRMAAELAPELSRQLRDLALVDAPKLPRNLPVFVNTHPKELSDPRLIPSLAELRRKHPRIPFVLEIHENAATNLGQLQELAAELTDLGVGLAYDDLGAGRARLLELVETTPRYVKFDRALVAGLPDGPAKRRQLVSSLVEMVKSLGIVPIAEGVETRAEAELCANLGFTHGQGWHFGRAQTAEGHQTILGR